MRGSPTVSHYPFVEIRPDVFRGMALRVKEWRAARLQDPVARLQFLQGKKASPSPAKRSAALRHLPAPAITIGLALTGAMILRPWAPSHAARATSQPRVIREQSSPLNPNAPSRVWLVETTRQSDLYSNGLRVENQFEVATAARNYLAYARTNTGTLSGTWRSKPAGIVFHTTESHLSPFEERQNGMLRREGEGLLEYVSRQRSYHFVIDRFGRVFRVVQESDYANHAGNSIWADDDAIYLNLNQSFFGVAFEAQTNPTGAALPANPAQIHAARILVEMLRARYAIPAANCVTHAQVSVNPSNGRAGYHTDWAANLPYADLGLSDNYQHPLPSVALFGFQADDALLQAGGAPLQAAVDAADSSVQREADLRKLPVERYRRTLLEQYRQAVETQRRRNRADE